MTHYGSVFIFLLLTTMLMAQNPKCVFCEIASGAMQQNQVVYRDNSIVAFMDYKPNNPGHVLVVPVAHAKEIADMPDSTAKELMSVARKISMAIKKTDIRSDAFRFQLNSGKAAGQEVMHCHMHVIPRFEGEVLNTKRIQASDEELESNARKIKKALDELK